MYKNANIIFIILFFLGLPFFLEAQDSPTPRSVRLPWPMDDNVWSYEVLIEKESEDEYLEYLQEFTQEFFIIVSLLPGKYRYRVIPYNILGNPEPEQGSEWRNFEIPDIVQETVSEESDDQDVYQDEEIEQIAEQIEEQIDEQPVDHIVEQEPEVIRDIDKIVRLWTVGISAGSSFATPWLITTVHGTIAPWKYSFLEIGCDLGFITEVKDAESYFSVYPFLHYAIFLPFKSKGGFYAGAGGGCMIANYTYPKEKVPVTIFAADVIIGVNFLDILDLSYTLRTNFAGVSNKFLVGYTYRFR
jgi:hypothetical protein